MKKKFLLLPLLLAVMPSASAGKYWPYQPLVDWVLSLNNGVVYIISPQVPAHCSHSRAQINVSETDFDRALYAYALSAKARNKSLKYVIDSEHTNCIIYGLEEQG